MTSLMRKRTGSLAGLFALILAASVVVLIPAPAQADSYGPVSIRFRHSGKCLDNYRGLSADYNMIQQWDCIPGNGSQKWYFDWVNIGGDGTAHIRNADTGKCIGRTDENDYNGERIVQLPCNLLTTRTVWKGTQVSEGNPSPDWYLMGNIGTGYRCLDVVKGSSANGTPIQLWDCTAGNWQQHTTW